MNMNVEFFEIIIGAGSAMALAITVLFGIVMTQGRAQNRMNRELGELQGRQRGIRDLSEEVLETVHRAIRKNRKHDLKYDYEEE
jgi:hypothetical protein